MSSRDRSEQSDYNLIVGTWRIILCLSLVFSCVAAAQEVKFIDLSAVQQRTRLRYPPALSPDCEAGKPCVAGGSVGGSIADGAPDRLDPHAVGLYLLNISPRDIDPEKPFDAEFRVLNTGLAPVQLPISPHLADLQPSDASASFSYLSLALVVHVEGPERGMPSVGLVQLYGAADYEGTTLVLKPGEWIRVTAKVTLQSWPQLSSTHARGEFWLRRNTFQPHPGGGSTTIENLYPNVTPTPPIDIRLHLNSAHSKRTDAIALHRGTSRGRIPPSP